MLEEIKCPICNEFYNSEGRIPIILNMCDHNICQECLFLTVDNKCPLDGKLINISQISTNQIFLNLIEDLNKKDPNIFIEDKDIKEKEEKLNTQIDLISEYLRIIQANYFIDDKQEYIDNTKKNVNNEYSKAKEEIEKHYSEYNSLTPKIETVIKDLEKNYLDFNNIILNEFEKDTNEIKEKYSKYQNSVNLFLDKLNKNIILKTYSPKEYLEESNKIITQSEEMLSKVNEYNEKTTKIFFKIKDINLELIMSTSKIPKRIKVHYIQRKSKDLMNYNDEEEDDPNNLMKESLSHKNDILSHSKSTFNLEGTILNSNKLNGSFSFNQENLSLGNKIKPKKLTRDNIVFIKNKMKNDNINCSGYSIGDEGVKKLLELLIKKNLEKKSDNVKKNNYKDLKLSKCTLTNEAMGYIKSILDVSKNTIIHLNLSRNYFADISINYICSITKTNLQLKEFKLNDNNFSLKGKEQIESFVKENNPKLRIEL